MYKLSCSVKMGLHLADQQAIIFTFCEIISLHWKNVLKHIFPDLKIKMSAKHFEYVSGEFSMFFFTEIWREFSFTFREKKCQGIFIFYFFLFF